MTQFEKESAASSVETLLDEGVGVRGNIEWNGVMYAKAVYVWSVDVEADNPTYGLFRRDFGPMDVPPFVDTGARNNYLEQGTFDSSGSFVPVEVPGVVA